jgi:tRNA-Thr(GGU) m(6)t(6)A37 methyltransferase TsaA
METTPIGIIHSPHQQATGTPIQSALASGSQGTVELFPQYAAGLQDLDGFERIWLLYWFDRAAPAQLVVTPYLDTVPRGLFATRAPARPNPIGLSSVRLLGIVGRTLHVEGLDLLDNTPLLDIKPYVPAFDAFQAKRIGWCGNSKSNSMAADGRFEAGETA